MRTTVERPNAVHVAVLDGAFSSGRESIERWLQRLLGLDWLALGVDDLIRALPGGDQMLVDSLFLAETTVTRPVTVGDGSVGSLPQTCSAGCR